VHGEDGARAALAANLRERFGAEAELPGFAAVRPARETIAPGE